MSDTNKPKIKVCKTVGELINILDKFDHDIPVRVLNGLNLYKVLVISPNTKNKVILLPKKDKVNKEKK